MSWNFNWKKPTEAGDTSQLEQEIQQLQNKQNTLETEQQALSGQLTTLNNNVLKPTQPILFYEGSGVPSSNEMTTQALTSDYFTSNTKFEVFGYLVIDSDKTINFSTPFYTQEQPNNINWITTPTATIGQYDGVSPIRHISFTFGCSAGTIGRYRVPNGLAGINSFKFFIRKYN